MKLTRLSIVLALYLMCGCNKTQPVEAHDDSGHHWTSKLIAYLQTDIERLSFLNEFSESSYHLNIERVIVEHVRELEGCKVNVAFYSLKPIPPLRAEDGQRFCRFQVDVRWVDKADKSHDVSFFVSAFLVRRGVDWQPVYIPTYDGPEEKLVPDPVNFVQYIARHLKLEPHSDGRVLLQKRMLAASQRQLLERSGFRDYNSITIVSIDSTTVLSDSHSGATFTFDWNSGYPKNIASKMTVIRHNEPSL